MIKFSRPLALALGVGLLTACAPMGVSALQVSDIVLYGLGERHVVFYGNTNGPGAREVTVGGQKVEVSASTDGVPPSGGLVVPGALSPFSRGSLQSRPAALGERFSLATIPLSSELSLVTRGGLEGVYYYDGRSWFTASGTVAGDQRLRARPAARSGLRGVGQLTDPEADALAAYLAPRGPLSVALLAPSSTPDALLAVSPTPLAYRRTALVVQVGVPTDLVGGLVPAPEAGTGRTIEFAVIGNGNSGYSSESFEVRLDASAAALAQTWGIVGANVIPAPTPPAVDFTRNRTVTLFLGQRPTGGYGLAVASTRLEDSTLVVEVNLRSPGPGSIVTQSFTSPFVTISVLATTFTSVRVVDRATGRTVAQSQR